jgi:hypothetical protein
MRRLAIYADEDVTVAVSRALRLRAFDAAGAIERGQATKSDFEQLLYAHSIGAVLLTHNVQDFPRMHYEVIKQGIPHSGIMIARQISVGEIVRSILRLASTLSAEDMENRLEYLSNW